MNNVLPDLLGGGEIINLRTEGSIMIPIAGCHGYNDGNVKTKAQALDPERAVKNLGTRCNAQVITRNMFINGYNGVWSIDHDDGSQYVLFSLIIRPPTQRYFTRGGTGELRYYVQSET